jgi:hypothetical protein
MNLEEAIKFHVDTGSAYRLVVKEVAEQRGFEPDAVETKIGEMVQSQVLARGPSTGGNDMLVVREWSPRTAAKMDEANV